MESPVKTKPLGFAFARNSEELPRGGQRAAFHIWNAAMLLLSSAGICVCSLLLAYGIMDPQVFFDYFRHPIIFLLNYLPVLLLQIILYSVTGKHFLAFILNSVLIITASVGNYFKLMYRFEPFLFSDMSAIFTALGVSSDYDLSVNKHILLVLISVAAGTIFLFIFAKGKWKARTRISAILLSLLAVIPLWCFVYSSNDIYDNKAVSEDHICPLWSQEVFASKGFVYPFIHSISDGVDTEPEGYDRQEIKELLGSFPDADIPADRRVNLIVFQLEAFSDLTRMGLSGISEDAYSLYHSLEQESYTGDLYVNIFGGGTVDTERCFLRGDYTLYDYTSDCNSFVRYLTAQGYTAVGSHPNRSDFYSRLSVNAHLGFEDYRFKDYYEEELSTLSNFEQSDCILFPAVWEQAQEILASGKKLFSFNVTMQTHSPYNETGYDYDTLLWDGSKYSDAANYVVNNYLGSVRDTQQYISLFADNLQECKEPVVLLLYGDHKPRLLGMDIYDELGINMDTSTPEGFSNYYATRYLIWANDAAKAVLGNDLVGEGPTVSAGNLMSVLFDQLGWDGPAIMQFEREIRETLPVVTSNGYYFEDGSFTTTLSDEGKALFDLLTKVQYYNRNNYNK